MRPVSAAFLETLRGSHVMDATATVLSTFQRGTAPIGLEIPIFSGRVVLDGTADVRGSLDLTTDGTGMWPVRAADPLAPYGSEIHIRRGVQLGGGVTEWCSLGYYRIQTPSQDDPPDGPIRITAKDRMKAIIDGRLLAPRQYGAAVTYGAVVTALVTEVYPTAVIDWDDTTDTEAIGRDLLVEEKRYEFLNDLVESLGKIWYWDHRGDLIIRTAPDPTDPVWDVNAGAGGVLVSMSRELTRDGVCNAVVASGEATDTAEPVRAVAIDGNPLSPTYYYGGFGPVPRFYSSPFLTTNAQAAGAAEAILRRQLGLPYAVNFTAIPNPALEPFDPVTIQYGAGSTEVHVLETVTVPLTEKAALTATTREQTVILIGAV